MNLRLPLFVSFAFAASIAASSAIGAANPAPAAGAAGALQPAPEYAWAEQIVNMLVRHKHYARQPLDDAFSRKILDTYLEGLDGTRSYLLAGDVAAIEAQFARTLDDALARNDVRPAFAIYAVYSRRFDERINHALRLLDQPIDLTVPETFQFDREGAPWAADAAALDDLWRRRVKNDVIGLVLTGKSEAEARELLRKRYSNFLHRGHQVKSGDVFESFMNAYLMVYDPHTSYLGPRDAQEFDIQMKLKYPGIGAQLQAQDDYVVVTKILPGSPAMRAGTLKEQDRITAVGQSPEFQMVDVVGWRLDDVVQLIRGPKDTSVRLQVLPADAAPEAPPKFVTLVRDEVKLEERKAQQRIIEVQRGKQTVKVGIIRLPNFYSDFEARKARESDFTSTSRDVRRLLEELKAAKVAGVVFDLRDNGGGSLQEAAELTGLFIDQGPVVQQRWSNGQVSLAEDNDPGVTYDGPLIVLVNRFSASASEIFAGAIQDYGRGLVVGSNTYGKGTIQGLDYLNEYLREGAANNCGLTTCPPIDLGRLKLTVGKFYRVTGSSTQHRGVVPDVALPSTIDETEFGESAQKTALPWDKIEGTEFEPMRVASGLAAALSRESSRRATTDGELKQFIADVAEARAASAKGSVSLVLAERRAERDRLEGERLKRENARRAARGEAPLAKLADAPAGAPEADEPDPLLEESAEILVDSVKLTGGRSLAQLVPAKR